MGKKCDSKYFVLKKIFYYKNHKYLLFNLNIIVLKDRVERYDLKSQLWLFFSPFLFPPKVRGKKDRRMNSKIVVLSHAFLLDRSKVRLKLGPSRHTRTTPKALPKPYTFFQCILSHRDSIPEPHKSERIASFTHFDLVVKFISSHSNLK